MHTRFPSAPPATPPAILRRRRLAVLIATTVFAVDGAGAAVPDAPAPAAAADTATATPPADANVVTVTATRRSATLQSVPIAVSVLDGEELERSNRNSIDSIVAELPSVTFRQSGGNKDTTIFVRGIGTISTSPGVEPTVSTVIDGVVYARPGQATADLIDIDQLEVLRGPQGTLFGKNASSGVVSLTSRKPTADTTGYIDASYYQGDEQRYKAGTTTLIDLLDTQRQQVAAEQSLSIAEAGLTGDFVAIQKALGLGWAPTP